MAEPNPLAQMFTQAGQTFLKTMAGQHGQTLANRIARPFQDFDQPWGKGPYWNPPTLGEAEHYTTRARWNETMAMAKKHQVHPLFALGMAPPSGASGPVMSPSRGGTGAVSGAPLQYQLSAAQLRESAARAKKDEVLASLYAAQAAKMKQSPGGDATATQLSDGTRITALPRGAPVIRRKLQEVPRKSSPEFQEVVGPGGERYRILSDEVGDEIKQLHYLYEKARRAVYRALSPWDRKTVIRPKYGKDFRYRR